LFLAEFFGALNLIFLGCLAASGFDFSYVELVSEKLLGIRPVFRHD
jgi:predicted cupin superfamily sugar epimerase